MFAYDPYAQLATLRQFAPLSLVSEDFEPGGALPRSAWGRSAGGADRSPHLIWGEVPEGTRSIALSCFDPDAPTGSGYWHWAVYNLPPTTSALLADAGNGTSDSLPDGAITLPNEARAERYAGSAPPPGTGVHRYFFVVDALDTILDLPAGSTPAVLGFNRHFHSLARGVLVGTATSD